MGKRIYLSPPHMGGKELEFVEEAFRTNWVAPAGPDLNAFEWELAKTVHVPYAAALSSGTAAIHLALIILGVMEKDEVLCSTFTFAGSCNPVVYLKATPVFVDSEKDTMNMDPHLLEEAIVARIRKTGKKPAAVILVHLYGMPAKLNELLEVARRYEVPVIEDAAEALGSTYSGKPLGGFGDIGIYSFNGNKIITTSGGGALVSSKEAWVQKARFLATQARDPAPHYEHSVIGYNYRLSNISAAIGRGQLMVLESRVNQRRSNYESYRRYLGDLDGVRFNEEPAGSCSNRWLTTIRVSSSEVRNSVIDLLGKNNMEARPFWKPMHLQPVYKECPAYLSGASEDAFNRGVCLPSGSSLSAEDLERVAGVLRKALVTNA